MKIIVAILAIICAILGVALIKSGKKVESKTVEVVKTITDFSNNLGETSARLEEQRQVNIRLTNMLDREEKKVETLTQQTKKLEGDVARVTAERDDYKRVAETTARAAEEAAKVAQQEIERRTAKITELEKENQGLTVQMADLTNRINLLVLRIAETERKLGSAEGERDFLMKELKRLQGEKAELERQFNDLKLVKEQVKKLTEEHHVALRLEWMRKGLYNEMKGAELLSRGVKRTAAPPSVPNLDVELRRDGPATIRTNTAPASK